MATIFGAIGLNDNDRVFAATTGQNVVYDVVAGYVQEYNTRLNAVLSLFVEGRTTDHKRRYKLPGGGFMARRAQQARGPAVKAYGQWDVAFPLEDWGEALWADDVSRAYMTAAEFQNHLTSILNRHANTVRYEMLKAALNNTQDTFVDPLWGSLSIEPLANGDAVVYPPVLGATDEATEDHYLESGYTAANIGDTNNPFATIRDELEEHFGAATGGENIVTFFGNAHRAKVEALSDFVAVPDRFVRVGDATDVPHGLPNVPGRVLGRVSGCWAVEWRHMPTNYLFGTHLGMPAPLLQRGDPADTGLPGDLTLVSNDAEYPFEAAEFRHRFGFGCGNRLNGVVVELGDGGTYTVPTGY